MDVNNQGLNIPSNLQNLDVRDELLSTEAGVGSAGAYSLRDLTGNNLNCVKVRRMQDDDVKDFSSGAVATGEVEQFAIGQDVLDMYNNAEYFGVKETNWWSLQNNEIQLGSDPFTITCDFICTDSFGNNTARVAQSYDGLDFFQFTNSAQFTYRINGSENQSITVSPALELGRKYSFEVSRDSSDHITLKIDGVTMGTNTVTAQNTGDCHIGRIGNFRLLGVVNNYNFNNGEHIIAGDGTDASDWADTGSVGGKSPTKIGSSHTLFTGQGIDAFVDTWFDQSGNGRNVTQDADTLQPKIISDGSLVTLNSKPALSFAGDGVRLSTTRFITTQGNTAFLVYDVTSSLYPSDAGTVIRQGSNYRISFGILGGVNAGKIQSKLRDNGGDTAVANSTSSSDGQTILQTGIFSATRGANGIKTFVNSTNEFSGDTTDIQDVDFTSVENPDSTNNALYIGSNNLGNFDFLGTLGEVILYNTDKTSDRTGIENEIKNYYGI